MIKNWDEIQESTFIGRTGVYTFKIKDMDEGQSSQGTDYHAYTCETKDGETIKVTLYLVDKALWKYKLFVKALGLEAKGNVDFESLPKSLIGRKFVGTITARVVKVLDAATGDETDKTFYEVSKFEKYEG